MSPLEWNPEWHIDRFTPKWRAAGDERQDDWVIAMMNYGGLIIFSHDGLVTEWDTAQGKWNLKNVDFGQWIEEVLREGDVYLKED